MHESTAVSIRRADRCLAEARSPLHQRRTDEFQSAVRIAVSLKPRQTGDCANVNAFQSAVRIAVSLKANHLLRHAHDGKFQSAVRIAVSLKLSAADPREDLPPFQSAVRIAVSLKFIVSRSSLPAPVVSIRRADRCLAEAT